MIPRLEQIALDAITKLKQISFTLTRLCRILPSPLAGEGVTVVQTGDIGDRIDRRHG
jgi:hypothetical protein